MIVYNKLVITFAGTFSLENTNYFFPKFFSDASM